MSLIAGCRIISNEKNYDNRGFFTRIYCSDALREVGKMFRCKQVSMAYNKNPRTARGLHLQGFPDGENKIVTCLSGSADIFVFDARIGSPTYKKIFSLQLSSEGEKTISLYVPKYCAFGYVTLTDECKMLYHMDAFYRHDSQIGYNLMDKELGIEYDFSGVIISDRDSNLPKFSEIGGV